MGNKTGLKAAVISVMKSVFRPKIYFEDESIKDLLFNTPSIIIANHTFAFNGAVIGTLLENEDICFLLAKDMFKGRLLSRFYTEIGCVPIDRQKADTAWIHQSRRILKEGKHICLFPEGKVSRDGETKAFKPGFLLLAQLTGAPIVPMYIMGEKNRRLVRQRVIVGSPHSAPKGLSGEEMKACAQCYRAEVLGLKEILEEKLKGEG